MKKISVYALFATLLSIILTSNCLALTVQDFVDGRHELNNERLEMESFLTAEKNSLPVSSPLNFEGAYKVYTFSNLDIVSAYKTTANIKGMISDEYKWQVPTENYDLVTVKMEPTTSTWELVGINFNDQNDIMKLKIIDKSSLYTTIRSRTSQISDLKYVEAPLYHTTFAYTETGEQEYLIPYGTRPDLTGLQNGKMYTASEAINILYSNFGEITPENNGGIPSEKPVSHFSPLLLIITGSIIGIVALGFILYRFFLLKKTRKKG